MHEMKKKKMILAYHLLSRHMRRFWGSAIQVPDMPQQSPTRQQRKKNMRGKKNKCILILNLYVWMRRGKKQMHININTKSECMNVPWFWYKHELVRACVVWVCFDYCPEAMQ